jgi:hypothetical protein
MLSLVAYSQSEAVLWAYWTLFRYTAASQYGHVAIAYAFGRSGSVGILLLCGGDGSGMTVKVAECRTTFFM